ncbi:Hypothetical protein I595_2582 [Croceitalea dokdonensis DOKDO 023]|uniref:Uncharacterized protein n=1 Tax=Croceitalea dokdonensis DOKDO 023 TaxID=1300341 RepID=A0A0N8H3R6_9FLAO|nr:Hypothetical protein I595_2582 [Croceitalea dokdonensis DOKDO 023]
MGNPIKALALQVCKRPIRIKQSHTTAEHLVLILGITKKINKKIKYYFTSICNSI